MNTEFSKNIHHKLSDILPYSEIYYDKIKIVIVS